MSEAHDERQAGDQLPPLVTADELDLSIVFPKDRILRIPVAGPRDDAGGPAVRAYAVRGRLSVDDMGRLLELETKLDDALQIRRARLLEPGTHDEVTDEERQVIAAVQDANAFIRQILVARNDDVPEDLGMDEEAVMVAMSWLVGDVSVADAVARAITAGASGSKTEEEILDEARARLDRGEAVDGAADAAPLPLRESS